MVQSAAYPSVISLGRTWLTSRLVKVRGSSRSRSATVMKQFRKAWYQNFVPPALAALKHIYREGLAYKRAGVMLLDLVEAGRAPISLFHTQDPRDDKLIDAFDAINDRLGPGAIQFGPAAQAAAWRSSSAFRSPFYTTRWEDIPKVKT